jgi:hypothetical protein
MVDLMNLSDQVDKDFSLIHWGGRRPFSYYAGETPSRS